MNASCLATFANASAANALLVSLDLVVYPGCGKTEGLLGAILGIFGANGSALAPGLSLSVIPVGAGDPSLSRLQTTNILYAATYTVCSKMLGNWDLFLNFISCLYNPMPSIGLLQQTSEACSRLWYGVYQGRANVLDACVMTAQANDAVAATSKQYSASNTPALYINGARYCGQPSDLAGAICAAASSAPPASVFATYSSGTFFKAPGANLVQSMCSALAMGDTTCDVSNESFAVVELIPILAMFLLAMVITTMLCFLAVKRRVASQTRQHMVDQRLTDVINLLAQLATRGEQEASRDAHDVDQCLSVLRVHPAVSPATDTCSICLEPVDTPYWLLDCQHVFHQDCLRKWFASKDECPVCRQTAIRPLAPTPFSSSAANGAARAAATAAEQDLVHAIQLANEEHMHNAIRRDRSRLLQVTLI